MSIIVIRFYIKIIKVIDLFKLKPQDFEYIDINN